MRFAGFTLSFWWTDLPFVRLDVAEGMSPWTKLEISAPLLPLLTC